MIEQAINLSIIEVFLGSFLHLLHIPFAGHFLSLNQGLFLTRNVVHSHNRFQSFKMNLELSLIVAIMKSLSPAGRRMGPMISITMQGLLFSLGTLIFGRTLIAQMISIILLGTWAFIQPVITYFVIYGSNLLEALNYYQEKLNVTNKDFFAFILTLFIMKSLAGIFVIFLYKFFGEGVFKAYSEKLMKFKITIKRNKSDSALKGAMNDLLRPTMLLSFLLMSVFFYLHFNELGKAAWPLLRSISIAFILFFCMRSPIISELLFKIASKNQYLKSIYEKAQKVAESVNKQLG